MAKLNLIAELGLDSSMGRNFEAGSMKRLKETLLVELPSLLAVESEVQYRNLHSRICLWGMENTRQTKRNGGGHASYGQIAKTLDVALKIIVCECHYPDLEGSQRISKQLNSAVDTAMMHALSRTYPEEMNKWPAALKEVDAPSYDCIQKIVRKFINEDIDKKYWGNIIPVQLDDMYWEALNRWWRLMRRSLRSPTLYDIIDEVRIAKDRL